jgi:hypothetical protein
MMLVSAFFIGTPGDEKDELCENIFETHGGDHVDSGTFLETYERDVTYELSADKVEACVAALQQAGFKTLVSEQ